MSECRLNQSINIRLHHPKCEGEGKHVCAFADLVQIKDLKLRGPVPRAMLGRLRPALVGH